MGLITWVSPSILATNWADKQTLEQNIKLLEKSDADCVHFDVCDGKFVETVTFDHKLVDYIKSRTKLLLDVHLMVENPEKVVDNYINAGADIITFHYEATEKPLELLARIKSKNILAGLAISPETPAYKLRELLKKDLIDVVVVMGVKPGKSGQSFIPGSAEKVAEIREMVGRGVYIEIDGGVNVKNSKLLRKVGANIIVSGKTVFESVDMKDTIRRLKGNDLGLKIRDFFTKDKKED